MEVSECADCYRLRTRYARATTRHILLVQAYGRAEADGDLDRARRLKPRLEAAEQARQEARQAVLDHEQRSHNSQAA